jgi:hypothetical protein
MAEPAAPISLKEPRSRRAVLAGAMGGIGALAATVIGGASRAQAAAGSNLIIGSQANNAGTSNTILTTSSSVVAFQLIQNGPGTALMGYVTPGTGGTRGVYGRSDSPDGDGVQARNAGAAGIGAGVRAFGGNNHGILATTTNVDRYAVHGSNSATNGDGVAGQAGTGGTGVIGFSTGGNGVFGTSDTIGVHGDTTGGTAVRGEATTGIGVWGSSTDDFGVYGTSTNSYAGAFSGPISTTKYLDMPEISEPADPPANTARLFVRDNASVTELCVKIGSTVYVLAPNLV